MQFLEFVENNCNFVEIFIDFVENKNLVVENIVYFVEIHYRNYQ